jgi:hypothetical protein
MIKLQRLNEIKYVQEEKDAAKLIAKGFKMVKKEEQKETEPKAQTQEPKEPKEPKEGSK